MGNDLDENTKDKLRKIIRLVKGGYEGEARAASNLLRKFCEKYNLDYYEVLDSEDSDKTQTFEIPFKTKRESNIVIGICAKILDQVEGFRWNRYRKIIYVECTQSQYFDLLYAVDIYLTAYRKEYRKLTKDLPNAFIMKHELWSDSAEGRELKPHEMEAYYRRSKLAGGLDDVHLRKGIDSGS